MIWKQGKSDKNGERERTMHRANTAIGWNFSYNIYRGKKDTVALIEITNVYFSYK